MTWYNFDCRDELNTRALCFPEAAMSSQSNIVGKAPFASDGLMSLAVRLDNGSIICGGRFAMKKITPIYLYIYRHRGSGKAYIGVTRDPAQRFKKHNHGQSSCTAFNRAVKKYGIESFDFRILAIFDDVEVANYHENAAIAAFGTLSPNGYNLIGGAPRSKYFGPLSQEVKDKIGAANRKTVLSREQLKRMLDARKGKPNHNLGKTFSDEYRQKLSDAHKGMPLSPEHRENMISAIKKTWANKTPEQMAEYSQKLKDRWANMTPEQRAEHSRKVSEATKGKKKTKVQNV